MQYKKGDKVVLTTGKIIEIAFVNKGSELHVGKNGYIFAEYMIDHEKTAELKQDNYTHALMKFGRREGDNLDNVNHPPHYTQGDIETIDIIKVLTTGYEGFEGSLVGNVIKYLARANFKCDKLEDIKKGQFYYNKLVEELEEEE